MDGVGPPPPPSGAGSLKAALPPPPDRHPKQILGPGHRALPRGALDGHLRKKNASGTRVKAVYGVLNSTNNVVESIRKHADEKADTLDMRYTSTVAWSFVKRFTIRPEEPAGAGRGGGGLRGGMSFGLWIWRPILRLRGRLGWSSMASPTTLHIGRPYGGGGGGQGLAWRGGGLSEWKLKQVPGGGGGRDDGASLRP